jgi:hypothetical protein
MKVEIWLNKILIFLEAFLKTPCKNKYATDTRNALKAKHLPCFRGYTIEILNSFLPMPASWNIEIALFFWLRQY